MTGPTTASKTTGLSNYNIPLGDSTLNVDKAANKGTHYVVYGINPSNNKLEPYPTTAAGQSAYHSVVIAYQLPDVMQDIPGTNPKQRVIYDVALHVVDSDNVDVFDPDTGKSVAVQCGNASWQFTKDGKGITAPGVCGEDSFLANGVFPNTGKAKPGDTVGAYYSDESTIQAKDITDTTWPADANFGIDFELSGGDFTDADGNAYQIPPASTTTGGYTLTTLTPGQVLHPDKFNTKLSWTLPPADDDRWVNGTEYTVFLRAYDTDNNKPGNDCGQGTWKFILTGATNGRVILME
jgi:hypothetical protein